MTATTIKVPSELRDRLNARARAEGTTVANVIEGLLAERARAERFRLIRESRDRMTPSQRTDLAAEYTDLESAALTDLAVSDD